MINRSDYVETFSQKSSFGSEAWSILGEIEQRIKHKVESIGVPLKEWNVEIYRGVLTGCNEAFIITSEKRKEILTNCIDEEERIRTAELIRPHKRSYVNCKEYPLYQHEIQFDSSNYQDVA